MIDWRRVFIVMFLACFFTLLCVTVLNWSIAHSQSVYIVHLPLVEGGVSLPTPAPTMPVKPPVYPPPAPTPTPPMESKIMPLPPLQPAPTPTPTPQVVCVEVWYENSHGLECSLAEWYEECTTTCDDSGCRRECVPVFYPTEMP